MAADGVEGERRHRWLGELEELYARKVELDEEVSGLERDLREASGRLMEVERRIRTLVGRPYGLKLASPSSGVVSNPVQAPATSVAPSQQDSAHKPSGESAVASRRDGRSDSTRTDASTDSRLRTPRQQKTWANIQALRRAIERLGGSGTRKDIAP